MERLMVPQGEFALTRPRTGGRDQLRAWDAADDYLLHHVAEVLAPNVSGATARPLVTLNDAFGALTTALSAYDPTMASDSLRSQQATAANLIANGLDPNRVTFIDSLGLDDLTTEGSPLGVVVIKIPKSLSLLEDQLHRLRPHLDAHSVIVAGAMTKHVHTSTLELFERILGTTTTTLARRKARLILCTLDPALAVGENPWPTTYQHVHRGRSLELVNHANVFSPTRLDIGTRCFLEHLPHHDHASSIVDLGCGNGIVGIALGIANPTATVTFVDESAMAVESTRVNIDINLGDSSAHRVTWSDGLRNLSGEATIGDETIGDESIDLIACNPPFHADHALADETAWSMMADSQRALTTGGHLWVVGNRHLAYHAKMKRLFGNCTVVGSNPKFVVYRSTKVAKRSAAQDSPADQDNP